MQLLAYSSLILAALLSANAQLADASADAELVAKLLTAPTQVQRLALLNDTDVKHTLLPLIDDLANRSTLVCIQL
jgi:hypothetical protein